MLYKVVLTLDSVNEIFKCDHFKRRDTDQYFLFMHFITCMLHKVAITFKSVD